MPVPLLTYENRLEGRRCINLRIWLKYNVYTYLLCTAIFSL